MKSDLFFMAGAITFNVLIAVVPLLLFVAGLTGFLLSARIVAPAEDIVGVVFSYFPQGQGDIALVELVEAILEGLVAERAGFSVLGAVILIWISTRLVGSLRVVLREVFGADVDRGIVKGKIFDFYVVFLGGLLLVLNVGVTLLAETLPSSGGSLIGLGENASVFLQSATGTFVSFASAWILFFLLYWYIPARKIPFRAAAVGATFTSVSYELMKGGFAWYVTSVATYSNAYGSLAVMAILFFWIYYSAVVFILGGQFARVYEVRREARMAGSVDGGQRQSGGVVSILILLFALPALASAQSATAFGDRSSASGLLNGGEAVVLASNSLERELSLDRPLVETEGPYVVVHIAESRVLVMEGRNVVWSAPAGTGHGFRLEGQGREWTFTTPTGMFHVLRKEKDPVWITPEWWYVERDLPIPAAEDRARIPGTLGTSALFLGEGIAIHGTDQPELLLNPDPDTRRVSHGCIRLTNEAARELYHRVRVGTPVLVF